MAQLRCKTRSGASPIGKPAVYFACHEQDHYSCFSRITDQILSLVDCAVFYCDPGESLSEEERQMYLERMVLVVPITARLLQEKLPDDVQYALDHHIPILPLMQEKGLVDAYRSIFGDIQFLDETNTDPTVVPYTDKLKKHLNAVLLADEWIEKIRKEFRAQIFLSYRKMDRRYAIQLMKRIHRDPACRDIAIWYDEYLTPGEDFNETIRQALWQSQLFLLVTTPHVLKKDNYILTSENPMARDQHPQKRLAAFMLPTSRWALNRALKPAPDHVNPYDSDALRAAILRHLGDMEVKDGPAHEFYIGLAYLKGVLAEVDRGRALELIQNAAHAGLTEAMEQLARMYETGDGVKQDLSAAIIWRKRLAEKAQSLYAQATTDESAETYMRCLVSLADDYIISKESEPVDDVTCQMHKLAGEMYRKTGETFWWCNVAACYLQWGDALFGDGQMAVADLDEAELRFTEGKEVLEDLLHSCGEDPNVMRLLVLAYGRLGDVCRRRGQISDAPDLWYEKAEKWYRLEKQTGEALAASGDETAQRTLWFAYKHLGDIARSRGKTMEAVDWLQKALRQAERFLGSEHGPQLRDLAVLYTQLGNLGRDDEQWPVAAYWYEQALTVLPQDGSLSTLRDRAVLYSNLGDAAYFANDTQSAIRWYEEWLLIGEKLATFGTPACEDELAAALMKLGYLRKDRRMLRRARQIFTHLAMNFPNDKRYAELVRCTADMMGELKTDRRSFGRRKKDNNG